MKIRIVKSFSACLMIVFSFFAWWAIDRAINIPDASTWLAPIAFVSLFFAVAYVNIIVIKRRDYLLGLFSFAYLISFIFVQNVWHIISFVLAGLLTLWAISKMKNDLRMSVEINIRKSLHAGSMILMIAMSIMITSQYYIAVKSLDTERLIPQFYISSISGNLTTRFLAATNPQIKNIDQENLTLDQFILQMQSGELQNGNISADTDAQIDQMIQRTNPSATDAQKKILKEDALQKVRSATLEMQKQRQNFLLSEGRKRFSDMSGRTLVGSEKMSDVMAGIINNKIDQVFGSGAGEEGRTSTLPYIMAIGLLLTILPLGSILNNLWMLAAQFFVWVFVATGIVLVKKVPVEMEVLE